MVGTVTIAVAMLPIILMTNHPKSEHQQWETEGVIQSFEFRTNSPVFRSRQSQMEIIATCHYSWNLNKPGIQIMGPCLYSDYLEGE